MLFCGLLDEKESSKTTSGRKRGVVFNVFFGRGRILEAFDENDRPNGHSGRKYKHCIQRKSGLPRSPSPPSGSGRPPAAQRTPAPDHQPNARNLKAAAREASRLPFGTPLGITIWVCSRRSGFRLRRIRRCRRFCIWPEAALSARWFSVGVRELFARKESVYRYP